MPAAAAPAAPGATVVVAEGNDFATRVLADPWDMNALSDVSVYLNRSGQSYDTDNINVSNGVFSAHARTNDANFTVLFPGYENMIRTGNDGFLKPIKSSTYHCLYIAMSVEGTNTAATPIWSATAALNNGVWGQTYFFTNNNTWQVYGFDINSAPLLSGTGWNGSANWQGLRIDPTNQADRDFAVDWVRLTDCAAVNATVHWPANGGVNAIWLRPSGTTRDILVKSGVSGSAGQATIDVQGIQPGTYAVRLGNGTNAPTVVGTDTLVVNQAPIILNFITPSAVSGNDYATQAGNPWDFANSSDLESTHQIATAFSGGLLDMVSQSGDVGTGGVDAQFFLNSAVDFNGNQYRYLSFSMFTEWIVGSPSLPLTGGKVPWPNMPDGMVARLVWSIRGPSGPTYRCYFVMNDVPFDIGWHTYTIDMFDSYNGQPEQASGECPSVTPSWENTYTIKDLRFDPNENITVDNDPITSGGPFHQQLDWIRLSAPDRVSHGTPYLIQLDLNRPGSDVNASSFYYTTSRSNPTQHAASRWTGNGSGASGPKKVYVPLVLRGNAIVPGADTFPQSDLSFWWNTAGVSPGTYYVCATITMNPNTATYCSDVPMIVD